jgi:hypothetical protein
LFIKLIGWLVGWFLMPHFDKEVICVFNCSWLAYL